MEEVQSSVRINELTNFQDLKVEDSWEGLNILRRRRSENRRNDKGNKSISNPNQMRSINWSTCALILTRSNTSKELSQEGGNGNYVQERIDLKDDYKSIGTKCGVVCIGNKKSCMVQVMCSFLHALVPKIKRVFISTNIFYGFGLCNEIEHDMMRIVQMHW